jgi:hypothetical protein
MLNVEECGRKTLWPVYTISLERLRKTTINLHQDSRFSVDIRGGGSDEYNIALGAVFSLEPIQAVRPECQA